MCGKNKIMNLRDFVRSVVIGLNNGNEDANK